MKLMKIIAITLAIYVAFVVVFGIAVIHGQPEMEGMGITLTTTDDDGESTDRILAGVHLDGHLYVSANHWPRSWYHRALANPAVAVTVDGDRKPYMAVPVTGAELERIREAYDLEFILRLITGFAPRRFLRLDPV